MTKAPGKLRSIVSRLRERLKPRKTTPAPAAREKSRQPGKKNLSSSFEALEGRIAPAAVFVNATTATYTDVDGDQVTVKFSKSILTAANVSTVLVTAASGTGEQLQLVDLAALQSGSSNPASGTGISVLSTQTGGGDGFANVGYIKAATSPTAGIPLGKVVVDGDLGQIDAGSPGSKVAISSLAARSIGAKGLTTQAGTGSLESNVTGTISKLTLDTDFVDATLKVVNGAAGTKAQARIKSLTIGGKLMTTAANTAQDAGQISVAGNIDKAKIGTTIADGIFGGAGKDSGLITADGSIKSIVVAGSIVGGAGENSGKIESASRGGSITVNGEVHGGTGKGSGYIYAGGAKSVTIGKTIIGGNGENSGNLEIRGSLGTLTVKNSSGVSAAIAAGAGKTSAAVTVFGDAGTIALNGSLDGSAAVLESAGKILVFGNVKNVTVAGSLKGGGAKNTGVLLVEGTINSVKIGTSASHGIFGGTGDESGEIDTTGTIKKVVISGSIIGGAGDRSGRIFSDGGLTKLLLNGDLRGGDGKSSGRISVGSIGTAVIGRNIIGGSDLASGGIEVRGNLGSLMIKNSAHTTAAILAGSGQQSGAVNIAGNVGTVTLIGNLDGSPAVLDNAGSVQILGSAKSIVIGGSLRGGTKAATGTLIVEGNLDSVRVGGSLLGAAGSASGSIGVGGKIKSATINGRLLGGAGAESGALRSGTNPFFVGDLAKVVVGGSVEGNLGNGSGSIHAGGKIGTAIIGPKPAKGAAPTDILKGGDGDNSGTVIGDTGIKSVTIRGHVAGGAGLASGSIQALGSIKTATILGSLKGAAGEGSGAIVVHDLDTFTDIISGDLGKITIAGAITGGAGQNSGQIFADGSLASLKVKVGGLTGQAAAGSGSILIGQGVAALADDYLIAGNAGSISIVGSIMKAGGPGTSVIDVGGSVKSLTVSGSISGAGITAGRSIAALTIGKAGVAGTEVINTTVSALGQQTPTATKNVAIGTVKIFGNVTDSKFLAGYDRFGTAADGSAQVKAVLVSGAWKSSSIVAGVADTNGNGFGNADDALVGTKLSTAVATIAKITIGGQVSNSASSTPFGFVSDKILSVIINGASVPLTANSIPIAGTNGTILQV